jgi:hypothetical protein
MAAHPNPHQSQAWTPQDGYAFLSAELARAHHLGYTRQTPGQETCFDQQARRFRQAEGLHIPE